MSGARIPTPGPLRRQATLRSQAMRGDERAFSELYRRHIEELYRYSLSILRNPEDASDAVQNSMTKAFSALQKEKRDFEVTPWLFRIVHNESITLLRKRRPATSLDLVGEIGSNSLAQSVGDRARLKQLQGDLQHLSEHQRGALIMRELSGLSHEEIGIALKCSTAVAKQAVFEARIGLAELEEGRGMECEHIQRALSDADGRVLRNRKIRAHLRDCVICSAFRDSIGTREKDLAALAPALPAAALAGLLAGGVGGGAATGAGATGSFLAGGAIGKMVAAATVTAALAGGAVTAERMSGHHEPAAPAATGSGQPVPARTQSAITPAVAAAAAAREKRKNESAPKAAAGDPPAERENGAGTQSRGKALGTAKGKAKKKPKKPARGNGKSQFAPGHTKTKITPAAPQSITNPGKAAK
jgi:RNA polymerase sigma factor (sigma-70 family)